MKKMKSEIISEIERSLLECTFRRQHQMRIKLLFYILVSASATATVAPTGVLSLPMASLAPLVSSVRTQAVSGIRASTLPLLQVCSAILGFFVMMKHKNCLRLGLSSFHCF